MKLYEIIATWFYSGYLKPAPGTWGTLAALPFCVITVHLWGHLGVIIGSCALFGVGLWAAHQYEKHSGEHDSKHVVIDEAMGMMVACLPLAYQFDWIMIALCFIGFRAFDVLKPFPVGWLDRHISGALGVMLDDLAAGLLTAILLGGIIWIS